MPHIEAMDITCARSMYNIDHKVTPKGKKLLVELSCIRPDVEIRYTEDGTEPVASSSLYASPLTVKSTTCMKAATFMNGEKMGGDFAPGFTVEQGYGKRGIGFE